MEARRRAPARVEVCKTIIFGSFPSLGVEGGREGEFEEGNLTLARLEELAEGEEGHDASTLSSEYKRVFSTQRETASEI